MIRKASNSRMALAMMYDIDSGIKPPVANWRMVQAPVSPPLVIPFGIRKHDHDMANNKVPSEITR